MPPTAKILARSSGPLNKRTWNRSREVRVSSTVTADSPYRTRPPQIPTHYSFRHRVSPDRQVQPDPGIRTQMTLRDHGARFGSRIRCIPEMAFAVFETRNFLRLPDYFERRRSIAPNRRTRSVVRRADRSRALPFAHGIIYRRSSGTVWIPIADSHVGVGRKLGWLLCARPLRP